MTEAEWLACNSIYSVMSAVRNRSGSRTLRLFLIACCREVWQAMTDWRCRRAVEVSERFADGEASEEDLFAAWSAVHARDARTAGHLAKEVADSSIANWGWAADLAAEISVRLARQDPIEKAALFAAKGRQLQLLRDITGNPFRPVSLNASWLAWNDCTVQKLAQAIYDERAFDRLPILSDALEEAGCDNADILTHLRRPGPHARGCWAVDLLIGKTRSDGQPCYRACFVEGK